MRISLKMSHLLILLALIGVFTAVPPVVAQDGACCFRDGNCIDALSEQECCDADGEYRGDGTTCALDGPCTGACCLSTGACVDGLSKEDCDQVGLDNGVFQGYGSNCGAVVCPALEGACCSPDGMCSVTSLANCLNVINGFFNGVGTICDDAVCAGACCREDGACDNGVTYNDCCNPPGPDPDGIFLGYDTTCAASFCPGVGACCIPGAACQDLLPSDCFAAGGCYQGDGANCAGTNCAPIDTAIGACLDPLGACVAEETQCECLRRNDYFFNDYFFWAGPGTTCAGLPHLNFQPDGGQVNISGATLFSNYAEIPGANNDFVNLDDDLNLRTGFPLSLLRVTDYGDCNSPQVFESMARTWVCPGFNRWWGRWILMYRSVGSLNGVDEFIDFQLLQTIPFGPLTERGVINSELFSEDNVPQGPGTVCPELCFPVFRGDLNNDTLTDGRDVDWFVEELLNGPGIAPTPLNGDFDNDGVVDESDLPIFIACLLGDGSCGLFEGSSPECPTSVDMASTDVPMAWVVRLETGTPHWNRLPVTPGYGNNQIGSFGTGYSQKLVSLQRELPFGGTVELNVNTGAPDANTVFDNIIAYSPVVPIANRGTGKENVKFTELQHHFVTGRLPTGENLIAATRDSGSGTRNAWTNSLGVDASWGSGDNIGVQTIISDESRLGPLFTPTNAGGSSRIEDVVEHARLALGYTGLFGSDRAAADALSGKYEILNVMKDVPGGAAPPGTQFVRPTINSVLDNSDPDTGWQIGGRQTLATRGDPFAIAGPTVMANQAAADYLRNLLNSILAFANSPFTQDNATPAQALSLFFSLPSSVDAVPKDSDPLDYTGADNMPGTVDDNPQFVQAAQDSVRATNSTIMPAYGSVNPANRVPRRISAGIPYNDGSPGINYRDISGGYGIAQGTALMQRMRIHGDFSADFQRNCDDIPFLMAAIDDPAGFQTADANGLASNNVVLSPPDPSGLPGGNYIVPEILGDFDGDGNFLPADIRYFADGLALDPATGLLNREEGFTRVDNEWNSLGNGLNFFGTTLATGAAYAAGDSRGDVAGNTTSPGAKPTGSDGVIDALDVDHVCANFLADWTDLTDVSVTADGTSRKDLSCDMDGDLDVDCDDVSDVVVVILKTQITDLNLDGVVTVADRDIACNNLGAANACWSQGDVNCDGAVNQADVDLIAAAAGVSNVCP